MNKVSRVLVVCALAAVVAACRAVPVNNVTDTPLAASSAKTQVSDVSEVIRRAGASLGWQMKEVAPGYIVATLALRTHVAVVDVRFDADSYSISYKDSTNLKYNGSTIHSNYNGWVENLSNAIKAQSSTL